MMSAEPAHARSVDTIESGDIFPAHTVVADVAAASSMHHDGCRAASGSTAPGMIDPDDRAVPAPQNRRPSWSRNRLPDDQLFQVSPDHPGAIELLCAGIVPDDQPTGFAPLDDAIRVSLAHGRRHHLPTPRSSSTIDC